MTLLAPLALLFLLSIPAVVFLYLLKVRLRDVDVSSTYLWERLLRDLSAQDPWQRPRFTLLMLIQMLLLAALVLALARPAWQVMAQQTVFEVVVLDASASMQATDVAPSRFARAKELAATAIRGLPEGSAVAIVVAGNRPDVRLEAATDREEALAALDQVQVSSTALDLASALRLATAMAAGHAKARIDLFTDGAFDEPSDLPEQSVETHYHLVGGGGNNRAITTIAARADPQNSRHYQVFVRVRNFAATPVNTTLAIYADGSLIDSRSLALGASSSEEAIFDRLPEDARAIQARLVEDDDLSADNVATVLLERRKPTKILLVSAGNLFLQRAVGLLPNVDLFRVTPARYDTVDVEPFDLVIFDGYLPADLPRQSMLVVNPPDSPLLTVEGMIDGPTITDWVSESPLLRYVSFKDIRVRQAAKIAAPGWARALVAAQGGPLLLAGEAQGRRLVVLGFDLQQSNLPLAASFPIFIANTVGYLEPAGVLSSRSVPAGTAVTIQPLPQADEMLVTREDGPPVRLPVSGRPIRFDQTDQVGLYTVEQRAGGEVISSERFAVNLAAEAESDIRPRSTGPAAGPDNAPEDKPMPVQRELWPWLLVAGLGLLTGEWWWYHRRA